MSNALQTLTAKLAVSLNMGNNGQELINTLKSTAFKGEVTDAQMTALMVVANQYGLNPWTKEIYAFPDKQNGIVPVVGVDGWSRIINSHQQFDGMEFEYSEDMVRMNGAKSDAPEWIECKMYRKDRTRPVIVREYLNEVYREPFKGKFGDIAGPWQSHPKRFLRHKAMIQCARLAFGYGGIYDQDEAEQIAGPVVDMSTGEVLKPATRPEPQPYPEERFVENLPKWRELVQSGAKTVDQISGMLTRNATLTDAQLSAIANLAAQDAPVKQDEHADFVAALDDDDAPPF